MEQPNRKIDKTNTQLDEQTRKTKNNQTINLSHNRLIHHFGGSAFPKSESMLLFITLLMCNGKLAERIQACVRKVKVHCVTR